MLRKLSLSIGKWYKERQKRRAEREREKRASHMKERMFSLQEVPDGTPLKEIELRSEEEQLASIDSEVRARLTYLVNSGKYNVVSISVFYDAEYVCGGLYDGGLMEMMVKVVIRYLESTGFGNKIRVDNVFGSGPDCTRIESDCARKIAWLRGRYDQLLAVDFTFDRGSKVSAMVYHLA